jgi:hypothetical protein
MMRLHFNTGVCSEDRAVGPDQIEWHAIGPGCGASCHATRETLFCLEELNTSCHPLSTYILSPGVKGTVGTIKLLTTWEAHRDKRAMSVLGNCQAWWSCTH